jgi:osmoprotectant transport system permease protein
MDAGLVLERLPELLLRTREHLFLTGVATGIAVACGIPLGMLSAKKRWLRSFVFGLAGIVQTIPSLAMLAFLLAAIGKIGVVPAVIALTLYALLPIIQNTATGLEGISPDILEASHGMGMTHRQQMKMVSIPLALPVIIAGVRTAAVISVGIATLSAFIGAGGLGEFINRGLALSDTRLILLGAVPSALLALAVSLSITAVEWGSDRRRRRSLGVLSGSPGTYLSFLPLLILLLLGMGTVRFGGGSAGPDGTITVGSKNFTEQIILAEMMAQRIEAATGLGVERKLNLGGTMICHEALVAGEIDLYAEYTGTALLAILKSDAPVTDPGEVYDLVAREYRKRFRLTWLKPFGFNNTYAIAVRSEDAAKRGLKTISDLSHDAASLRAGLTAEFSERPDGYPGLRKTYGFEFGRIVNLDPALMYDAIRKGQVDLITAFSTDSRILGYNLSLLEDDMSYFPPYHAAPVMLAQVLERHPELMEALAPLRGLLDEKVMQQLNYKVDQEERPLPEVVREFLEARGLL